MPRHRNVVGCQVRRASSFLVVEDQHLAGSEARTWGGGVEAQIDRKKTWTYERAVEPVAFIRMLYERGGDPSGFDAYLADLRLRHRQKAKLIRLLDEAGLR